MIMRRKIRLTESELHNLIKTILEQSESEDYYIISNKEYEELMKLSGYHGKGVTKLPKFGGKPLYIKGNVDLSKTDTDSLGNVAYIDGNLSISGTKIQDLGDTKVRGYVQDSGTPRERIRIKIENERKVAEMDSRREDGDWDLSEGIDNIEDIGVKANALYKYLVDENLIDKDEYDVYYMYPLKYKYYGLDTFQPIFGSEEYTVGTSDEMDSATLEYAKNYIDDVGIDGFRDGYIDNYIDIDYLKGYVEDYMRDDIYSNPEVYFDKSDYELTDAQEKRIEEIEEEIEDYEQQQKNLEGEIDDPDEYSRLWDDFQQLIDELEEEKSNITPDDEPTDDMVERKLQDYLDDVANNPVQYIREHGLELKNFVDEDELAKGIADDDGWEMISSYDGTYETVYLEDRDLYIMRVN